MDGPNWGDGPERHWYHQGRPESGPGQGQAPRDLTSFFARDRRKALRWSVGIVAAAVLAGGGAIAGVAVADHGTQPANQGSPVSAAVNTSASPGPGQAGLKAGARHRALARLRGMRGIHGEATVKTKNGGFREVAFERGVIQSVSGQDVVVRSADGTTWTWTLAGNTAVRDQGKKATASSLASGDRVFVAGPQSGSTRTARVIIVPKTAAGSSGSTPASGSPASGT